MLSKNKLGFKMLGRVTADPDRKATQGGKDYVSLSLRVDSRPAPEGSKYKYEGEAVYVSCWGSRGESALHLQKGDRVEVPDHRRSAHVRRARVHADDADLLQRRAYGRDGSACAA